MAGVGYLTVVFADHVTAEAAHHFTDEIAGEAISYEAVDAVKCDVGVLNDGTKEAFWREAAGNEPRTAPEIEDAR